MKKILNRKVSAVAAGVVFAITAASASAYEVKQGDTLFEIAQSMGTSLEALLEAMKYTKQHLLSLEYTWQIMSMTYLKWLIA